MFAFEYPKTGDFLSVYFDMQNYYFDYNEIKKLVGCSRYKSSNRKRMVNKFKRVRFLSPDETLVLLDSLTNTEHVQNFIINNLYPVLKQYKKSYNKPM